MTGGFSFCGVDIGTIGLEYAPELQDTYVYRPTQSRIFEETFDSHHGGYFYGVTKDPKEFHLRCIFEEKEIDRGLLSKVFHMFRVGRTGKLVFSRRPWCEYIATVVNIDDSQLTNYLNGMITIEMKAYYPYGTYDKMWISRKHVDFWRAMQNTALLEKEKMIPDMKFGSVQSPLTEKIEQVPIILLNPGNETAPVGIEIAGDTGTGVTIKNLTTGQRCRFINLKQSTFNGENCFLYLDSLTGKTMKNINGRLELQFQYHDYGYLYLAPNYPCVRDMFIYTDDGTIYSKSKLYDHRIGETREDAEQRYVGKYIWLNDMWCKITGIGNGTTPTLYDAKDEYILRVNRYIPDGLRVRCSIYQMNEIAVIPDTTMSLTRLNFIYKATFS